jgi:SAM-dependent methyltransferase
MNDNKLNALLERALVDFGAVYNGALVVIGDRLGLYRAMDGAGLLTPAELAQRTGTTERYIQEWLNAQAAGGYVDYDPATRRYSLSEEQAYTLANEDSPVFLAGGFQTAVAAVKAEPEIAQAFRTGEGFGWHRHDSGVFTGTERFFRASYLSNLVSSWVPALDGVEEKLRRGARVADIGCGHGASTILLAQAYPESEFVGFDYHGASIEQARRAAREAGVADRVRFEQAVADSYPGSGYDVIAFFDSLHDMGDPVSALRHAFNALDGDGTVALIEPRAGESVEENLNPVGRAYYAAGTLLCVPGAMSQEKTTVVLGPQAGEALTRQVATTAGFTRFHRAVETPFNVVYQLKR